MPPFSAIRAFEAAARYESVRKASEELHVTPSAITHRVKALEAWLGGPLFRREGRRIRLTALGQEYFYPVHQALNELSDASHRIANRANERDVLTIATMDSFATLWLVPRLPRFRKTAPEIDVRITTADRMIDFARENIDLAIRYGRNDWDGVRTFLLYEDEVFPVCSAEYLRSPHALTDPPALGHHTLLHDAMQIDWRAWLHAARSAGLDVADVDPKSGPYFDHSYLAIQAAISGEGVALASKPIVLDALADGRLVRPFEFGIVPDRALLSGLSLQLSGKPQAAKLLRLGYR
ncbi:MAG: transcriptional regulator GcvA [Gammaproteobacteria bacterium]